MALATNDLAAVQMAGGMGLVALVDAVVMGVAAIAFMAYIQPLLTVIAIAPLPLLAVLTRLLSARLHHRFKIVQEQFSHLTEFARATIASIRLVKAYNQEHAQGERFNTLGETYIQSNLRVAVVHGTLYPLAGLISNLSLLLAIYFRRSSDHNAIHHGRGFCSLHQLPVLADLADDGPGLGGQPLPARPHVPGTDPRTC